MEGGDFYRLVIGHVRYINIQAWLRGFRVKIANFSSFFCPWIPIRDLDKIETTPNIEVWPESLGAMLEYWYIDHGLFFAPEPHRNACYPGYRETTKRTGLNLSVSASGCWIWAPAQILNGPIRVNDETTLRAAVVQPSEANFKVNFSFFTSLSTLEAQVFGVKFIGLKETVGFIAIRDFSFWGDSDFLSDVWAVMDGAVSLLAEV